MCSPWQTKCGQKRIAHYEAVELPLDSVFQIPYEGVVSLDMSACCVIEAMRRREKRDSLLSACRHTHKHVCTHTDIGMNEPIHSKYTFYWFIRLGSKSHHLNLPELSCTYQKNVSPAIPVSLFVLTQVLKFLLSVYQILKVFHSPENGQEDLGRRTEVPQSLGLTTSLRGRQCFPQEWLPVGGGTFLEVLLSDTSQNPSLWVGWRLLCQQEQMAYLPQGLSWSIIGGGQVASRLSSGPR